MKVIDKPLPQKCYSSKQIVPTAIVLHFISAKYVTPDDPYNMQECWNILENYGFSYHFMIGRDGEEWQLVPATNKAFHAGKSEYKGKTNWNNFSVGVTFLGDESSGFTEDQYDRGRRRLAWLIDQFPIRDIVGHEDIAGDRGKVDPGIKSGNFILQKVIP